MIAKLPHFVRWIMVIPSVIVAYIVTISIARFIVSLLFGSSPGLLGQVIAIFMIEFCCIALSLIAGCLTAPSGHIILASIFLGGILIYAGANIASPSEHMRWVVICSSTANILAGVLVLISNIGEKMKNQRNLGKTSLLFGHEGDQV